MRTNGIHPARLRGQLGLSLIELLVSMAIGLIIMVAAISAYLGSAGAGRMAEAQSRMNEDAQAALSVLRNTFAWRAITLTNPNRVDNADPTLSSLRNPVYGVTSLPLAGTHTMSLMAIRGCDGTFTNINSTNASTTGIDSWFALPVAPIRFPNSIAVSYEADRFNTIPTASGLPTDCLGNSLPIVTATVSTIDNAGAVSAPPQTTHIQWQTIGFTWEPPRWPA